jgi:DNA polymerase/3'-5' exonuclease PolX
MVPKVKFPRAAAIEVARELVRLLGPVAERLVIAGSLRRRKPEVGDVEVLYIPRTTPEPDGLFDTVQANLADRAIQSLLDAGVLAKRLNSLDSEMWGPKNKLAVHLATGIPVDLFAATPANWFNYLVCRTGSADNNTRIATAAKSKGWTWKPYAHGFLDQHANWQRVTSEQDVFALAGLPYLDPWQR